MDALCCIFGDFSVTALFLQVTSIGSFYINRQLDGSFISESLNH